MTKVVHLQTHLPSSGNAAYRLHEAMRHAGVDSSILTLSSDISGQEHIHSLGRLPQVNARLNALLQGYLTRHAVEELGFFSYPVLGNNISRLPQVVEADIIYLHWAIGGFLSLHNIEQLVRLGKPVFVFMHDMWAFTGGCHYSFECVKYKSECSDCQLLPKKGRKDLGASGFKKKLNIYAKYDNLYFISPSKWLHGLAKSAAVTAGKPIFHIPNILNRKLFKPIDKTAAKQLLDIDPAKRVLTFGAASVDSPYKGWRYLQNALNILHQQGKLENISMLVFGSADAKAMQQALPCEAKFLGRLRDDYSTALVYNASDVFVAPSLADNLPTAVMESLACGTPAVGFDTGGIPDMIQHKVNGYLAKYRDAEDLANGISYCLDHGVTGGLSQDFDTQTLMEKHFELFDKVLTKHPAER